jgi:hypothetical protein
LEKRKKTVLDLFRLWDKEFFPASETSLGGKQKGNGDDAEDGHRDALAALNNDEDEVEDMYE